MEKIKQMFTSLFADVRDFFADPKSFWANASNIFRVYILSSMIADIGFLLLVSALVLAQLEMRELALPLLGLGVFCLVLGFIAALWAGLRGSRSYVWISVVVIGLLLLIPTMNVVAALSAPRIHDISTDLKNPPEFQAVKKIRPADANPLTRKQKGLKTKQRRAYPKVKTLRLYKRGLHPGEVFEVARDLVHDRGWEIVAVDPKRRLIEATASTLWLGFKDDVIIRVLAKKRKRRPIVVVDMRSVSRFGQSDIGKNAQRITSFLNDIRKHFRRKK